MGGIGIVKVARHLIPPRGECPVLRVKALAPRNEMVVIVVVVVTVVTAVVLDVVVIVVAVVVVVVDIIVVVIAVDDPVAVLLSMSRHGVNRNQIGSYEPSRQRQQMR